MKENIEASLVFYSSILKSVSQINKTIESEKKEFVLMTQYSAVKKIVPFSRDTEHYHFNGLKMKNLLALSVAYGKKEGK